MAQRSSRKRRKQRQRSAAPPEAAAGNGGAIPAEPPPRERMARGYARGRAKDEAARAALKPLREGERPTAVTVGAVASGVAALANIVAMVLAYDPDAGNKSFSTGLGTFLLIVIAVGMWRARYWAVLGMQALLALTMIFGALALLLASNVWGALLALAIVASSGTLFWFLVKAMARIQMPERPGGSR